MDTEQADPAELAFLRSVFGREGGGGDAGVGGSRDRDPDRGPDGAGAPLGWEGVREFERRHGVVLPEPYRTFVAEIADGWRAGPPDHGLVPLASLPPDWGNGRPERVLSRPFPLTRGWYWDDEGAEPCAELDARIEEVFNHGSVVLGTDGCGMYWHLVVTGPQRGHIWLITGEGAGPFGAEFGFTTARPGFAGWVGHWSAGRSWFDEE
jgi:hypothetical protein